MPGNDKINKISKTLSYVLRHNPASVGIIIDENGWVNVHDLLARLKVNNEPIPFDVLKHVVDTNNKKRFAFNEDFTKIRASQGHSINVDLNYSNEQPPPVLYHGTTTKFLASILAQGLKKMNRQHVHLSSTIETALNVGQRHGKPVVLTVKTASMYQEGFAFYLSENKVWLTDNVPAKFIEVLETSNLISTSSL